MNAGLSRRAIPPVRCSAWVVKLDRRCRNWSIPGSGGQKCRMHGGSSPQVKAGALVNNAVATLLAQDPRPVEQVVIEAIHIVDSVMREQRAKVEASEDVSVKDLGRLVHLSSTAHALASSAVTQKLITFQIAQGRVDAAVTRSVLLAAVDVQADHLAPSGRGKDLPELRLWMIRAAQAAVREVEARQSSGSLDLEVEAVQHRAGDRSPLADAVREVPWDVDLVVMTRADVAELARLRRLEAERERAAKALTAYPHAAPVMGRPGMPGGWRSGTAYTGGTDAADESEPHPDDLEGLEAPALVGRVVPPWDGPWNGSGGDDHDDE